MCRDRLLAAGLAGLAGTLADEVLYWVPVLAGVADAGSTTGYYLAEIIFAANELTAAQILVGELAHFIVGGALGIAALILLQSYGHDYILAKGAALGAVFWLVHTIVVPGFVAARIMIVHGVSEVLFDLVVLIVWGVVATVTLTRLIPSPLPDSPDAN